MPPAGGRAGAAQGGRQGQGAGAQLADPVDLRARDCGFTWIGQWPHLPMNFMAVSFRRLLGLSRYTSACIRNWR